jgi:DNA-directed RNA polymerase beta' subunit
VAGAQEEVDGVWSNYMMGLITDNERYNQVIDIWTRTNTLLTNTLMRQLEEDQQGFNSIYMMMHSGARGSREQIRQLGGMRGLMASLKRTSLVLSDRSLRTRSFQTLKKDWTYWSTLFLHTVRVKVLPIPL